MMPLITPVKRQKPTAIAPIVPTNYKLVMRSKQGEQAKRKPGRRAGLTSVPFLLVNTLRANLSNKGNGEAFVRDVIV